jgi:hypothetical protein
MFEELEEEAKRRIAEQGAVQEAALVKLCGRKDKCKFCWRTLYQK